MRIRFCLRPALGLLLVLSVPSPVAQDIVDHGFVGIESPAHDRLPTEVRERIQAEIARNVAALEASGRIAQRQAEAVPYGWPLRASANLDYPGFHGVSNFVDHDADYPGKLRDYMCGTRTYDLQSGYNHQGTDYFTWPFGWHMMDHDLAEVVSIAPGVIVARHDGEPDRNCDFSGSGVWNAVYVRHADGSVAWYGHLKRDSLTPKEVGEAVEAGEYLGVIGSSGFSTGPHLHLELYDAEGALVDPHEGECNPDAPSLWAEQRPYYDSAINAVLTHHAPPVFPTCPEPEVLNLRDAFEIGDQAYGAVYLRDQRQGQEGRMRLRRPNGTLAFNQPFNLNVPHYAASYWYWALNVSSATPVGVWQWEFTFEGETHARSFTVGQGTRAGEGAPLPFALSHSFPNPTAGAARFTLRLEASEHVRATVYDLLGRPVALVYDGPLAAGTETSLEVAGLASGAYVLQVIGETFSAHRAVTVAR
jgi:murein DD-endopeptidase MepM/ murein hydrolase activator NlpD